MSQVILISSFNIKPTSIHDQIFENLASHEDLSLPRIENHMNNEDKDKDKAITEKEQQMNFHEYKIELHKKSKDSRNDCGNNDMGVNLKQQDFVLMLNFQEISMVSGLFSNQEYFPLRKIIQNDMLNSRNMITNPMKEIASKEIGSVLPKKKHMSKGFNFRNGKSKVDLENNENENSLGRINEPAIKGFNFKLKRSKIESVLEKAIIPQKQTNEVTFLRIHSLDEITRTSEDNFPLFSNPNIEDNFKEIEKNGRIQEAKGEIIEMNALENESKVSAKENFSIKGFNFRNKVKNNEQLPTKDIKIKGFNFRFQTSKSNSILRNKPLILDNPFHEFDFLSIQSNSTTSNTTLANADSSPSSPSSSATTTNTTTTTNAATATLDDNDDVTSVNTSTDIKTSSVSLKPIFENGLCSSRDESIDYNTPNEQLYKVISNEERQVQNHSVPFVNKDKIMLKNKGFNFKNNNSKMKKPEDIAHVKNICLIALPEKVSNISRLANPEILTNINIINEQVIDSSKLAPLLLEQHTLMMNTKSECNSLGKNEIFEKKTQVKGFNFRNKVSI